jgi:uncharacterized iron-regulated protein
MVAGSTRRTMTRAGRVGGAILLPLVLGWLGGCHGWTRSHEWISPIARDHPLAGTIFSVEERRAIDPGTLIDSLLDHTFVLLGEKHDNADHHRLQARILRALLDAGRRPAVAFEMLSADLAPALDGLAERATPAALRAATRWDGSGWPPWEIYEPIFSTALRARLPIVPAGLDPAWRKALGSHGAAGLAPDIRHHLGLDLPLPADQRDALVRQIRDAHCGHAPASRMDAMVEVQRARDAQMARALIAAGRAAAGAALVAGTEHVRRDRGVPVYLRRWGEGASVTSVAFLEVGNSRRGAAAELTARYGSAPPFEFVWFTPRVDDRDPCEEFRDALERLAEP